MDDIVLALQILGGILGFAAGLALGTLIAAVALRMAGALLGFQPIPFGAAYKSEFLANFVAIVLNFAVGFNCGASLAMYRLSMSKGTRFPASFNEIPYSFPPMFYLLALIVAVVTTALIFCRTLPTDKLQSPLTLRDGLALAAVYQAVSFAFVILLVLVITAIIYLFIGLLG